VTKRNALAKIALVKIGELQKFQNGFFQNRPVKNEEFGAGGWDPLTRAVDPFGRVSGGLDGGGRGSRQALDAGGLAREGPMTAGIGNPLAEDRKRRCRLKGSLIVWSRVGQRPQPLLQADVLQPRQGFEVRHL